jgi:phospholipase C
VSAVCGTAAAPPTTYRHVVWIWMENHSIGSVIGPAAAPFTNSLATQCGLATNYLAISHPSLPNYIAATSGDTQGIHDDAPPAAHPLSASSIYAQVKAAGLTWRDYEEAAPGNCPMGNAGRYAVKHDPAPYYTGIRADCAQWDVPLGSPTAGRLVDDIAAGALPAFAFITPDLCNDTHDCGVSTGDGFLRRVVPALLRGLGPHGFLVVTYDEGSSDAGCCGGSHGGRIPTIVAGPDVRRGARQSRPVDQYGVLRTIETALRLPRLGASADPRHGDLQALFARVPRVR